MRTNLLLLMTGMSSPVPSVSLVVHHAAGSVLLLLVVSSDYAFIAIENVVASR